MMHKQRLINSLWITSCQLYKLWIKCEQWMPGAMPADSGMAAGCGRGDAMQKMSSEEYLASLEDEGLEDDGGEPVYTDEGPEELSEAERMAESAEGPRQRADGNVVGTTEWKRQRPLTTSQLAFARGLIEGKSMRQAYRDAYPNSGAADVTVSAAAGKLAKDPRIGKLVRDAWEETQEALADDVAASRRYVMRQLVALSKQAGQEGSRLKALELLGRSVGMFREQQASQDKPLTAAELRAQLAGHLKLVGQTTRKQKTGTDDA